MTRRRAAARTLIIAEPPASFREGPPLTVDCSVLAALLFDEAQADEAQELIAGCTLHAPALLDYEFANVVARKAATGHSERAALALDAYLRLGHQLHRTDVSGIADLAQRYALSAYDAAYLWLAGALRTPLATFDTRLGKAAQRYLGSLGKE
jgi:predicted nucleic acid-binding protein